MLPLAWQLRSKIPNTGKSLDSEVSSIESSVFTRMSYDDDEAIFTGKGGEKSL